MAVSKINNTPAFDLLWTNPSLGQFAAQTISLDLSKYDAVKIIFYGTNASDPTTGPMELSVGTTNSIILWHALTTTQVNNNVGTRTIVASATGVQFSDYTYKNYISGTSKTTQNNICVPWKIYGVKY